jgi:hypothetical protein
MRPAGAHGGRRRRGAALVVMCLVTVLSASAAGAQHRVRFHGYVQWIAGSKMVLWTDAGASVTVDLSEADQDSYRGLTGGDRVRVEAEVRRRTRRDSDEIPLVAKAIELDSQ